MKTPTALLLGLLVLTLARPVAAQTTTKHVISLAAARTIATAAEAEANRRGVGVVIAIVDDGGYPILVVRLDDTQVASVDVGVAKARTAAIFRRPSKVFEDQLRDGRIAALGLPGSTPLQGGVPIQFEGRVVGAIGVSGDTPQADEDIAFAGAAVADTALRGEPR